MRSFFKLHSLDLAIDLGTSNTLIYARDHGLVLNEPSVVAIETVDGFSVVRAIGSEAKAMMGRTPNNVRVVRPLKNGVIADFDIAEEMIKRFIRMSRQQRGGLFRQFDIAACIPSGATSVQQRAIRDVASNSGGSQIFFIKEPMAAAIGAGLPVDEPTGTMVVDIGGGTTEVAIISLMGLAYGRSANVGGDTMDEAIMSHVRRTHNLLIGETAAERIKIEIASAIQPDGKGREIKVRGRDLVSGMPKEIVVNEDEIATAIADSVGHIVDAVLDALEHAEPELASDIVDRGIVLIGGGALLGRIDEHIAAMTGLAVVIADEPQRCVVTGAGRALEDPFYRMVLTPA